MNHPPPPPSREATPAGPTTIPEATVEVGQKYLSNNGRGPMLAEILAVEGETVRYQWHNITATKRPQFRINAAPIRYFTQYGWVLQTGPAPAAAKSKDAQIAELRSELARERRRTATYREALLYVKQFLDEYDVDRKFHPSLRQQVLYALAGPGGDETAGVT
jgi:hypothetical protein